MCDSLRSPGLSCLLLACPFPQLRRLVYVFSDRSIMPALTGAERARLFRQRRKAGIAVGVTASKQCQRPTSAFVAAFEADLPKLRQYARAKLYGATAQQDADDIAAQVALRFTERGGTIRDVRNVRAWSRRVVRSLLADRGEQAGEDAALRARLENDERGELEGKGIVVRRSDRPGKTAEREDETDEPTYEEAKTDEDRALRVGVLQRLNPYHQPEDDEKDDRKAATLGAPNLLCRDSASDRWLAAFVVEPIKRRGGLPVRVLRSRHEDQLLLERTA